MRLYKQGATPPEPPNVAVLDKGQRKSLGKILHANTVIESGDVFSYDGKRIKSFTKASYASLKRGLKPGMYVLKINEAGAVSSKTMMIDRN